MATKLFDKFTSVDELITKTNQLLEQNLNTQKQILNILSIQSGMPVTPITINTTSNLQTIQPINNIVNNMPIVKDVNTGKIYRGITYYHDEYVVIINANTRVQKDPAFVLPSGQPVTIASILPSGAKAVILTGMGLKGVNGTCYEGSVFVVVKNKNLRVPQYDVATEAAKGNTATQNPVSKWTTSLNTISYIDLRLNPFIFTIDDTIERYISNNNAAAVTFMWMLEGFLAEEITIKDLK